MINDFTENIQQQIKTTEFKKSIKTITTMLINLEDVTLIDFLKSVFIYLVLIPPFI